MNPPPPSYVYSSLDRSTLSLAQELESLGGGDATVSPLELHVVVRKAKRTKGQRDKNIQIYWAFDNVLGVRDTMLPVHQPSSQNMKYITPVTSTIFLDRGQDGDGDEMMKNSNNMDALAQQTSNWLLAGFNNCVLAIGARDTGKTSTLFGNVGDFSVANYYTASKNVMQNIPSSFSSRILDDVYTRKEQEHEQGDDGDTLTIALSAWVLFDNQIVDLMAPGTSSLIL